MQIIIRFGEPFWRAVGERNLTLEVAPGITAGFLVEHLCHEYPALSKELLEAPPHIFINEEPAQEETHLEDGALIHLVWALSGG